jgi:tetratricopeptide (TPR) repeat protein
MLKMRKLMFKTVILAFFMGYFCVGGNCVFKVYAEDTADSGLLLKNLFHEYRETAIGESIKVIAPVLLKADVLILSQGEWKNTTSGNATTAFRCNKDKNGQYWLLIFTDEAEFKKAFTAKDSFVEMRFADFFDVIAPNKEFGGIYINSGSQDSYVVPSLLFESLKKLKENKDPSWPTTENSPGLTAKEGDSFNKYFNEAGELLKSYMFLDGVQSKNPTTRAAKRDLKKSIELFSKALKIYPESWQSYWLMGKAYQALGESNKTYDSFKKAYSIMPDDPDVASEYLMTASEVQKNKEAISVGEEAIKKFPNHVGLSANYSVALLLDGQVDEAYAMAQKALELKPDDPITRGFLKVIEAVKSGKYPPPKSYWELMLRR